MNFLRNEGLLSQQVDGGGGAGPALGDRPGLAVGGLATTRGGQGEGESSQVETAALRGLA